MPTALLLVLFALLASCTSPAAQPDGSLDGSLDSALDAASEAPSPDAGPQPPPSVTTSLGVVRGTRGSGYQAFLGIPYAEPPVDALRWLSPVRHAPWSEPRDATTAGSACAQNALGAGLGSEDCLFVNVHAPDPLPSRAPVLVWIHGGAFVFGEGLQTDHGTAGDLLASRHGMVVVSMNYRLGNFGWFTNDALGAKGNQGFEDQQLALRWVHDNIAAFGGDPGDVTIAGESAGGLSVCLHLIAPGSQGLFHRAISESGFCDSALPSRARHVETSNATIHALGCDTATDVAACMRGKSTNEVRAVGAVTGDLLAVLAGDARAEWPDVDGQIIPGTFRARVTGGNVANVPTLLGWNHDEGTLFVALVELTGGIINEDAYHRATMMLSTTYGVAVDRIEAQYPLAAYPEPGAAMAEALGHAALACPSRRAALVLSQAGLAVHTYHFIYPDAPFQLVLPRTLGAFHSSEIQFVFGHPASIGTHVFAGEQYYLWQSQSAYWSRFVSTGDPNDAVGATVAWPTFTLDTQTSLVLDRTIATESRSDGLPCALWDPG